ncbi:type III ribulose-bisphosphate carboxylase [Candidatus Woesearchaeota archaeon]|nr:type III ribulose-bisphosphate carboxylase [Candidatus Woesearchaeota archaeon]
MKIKTYIDKGYKPGRDDLITEYYLEPNRISTEKAADHIAAESSIGTWTDIGTLDQRIIKRLKPSIFDIDKNNRIIKIAYHHELFEPGNMPEILSSIAGNIFGMKSVRNLRLMDIHFPKRIIDSFKGPRYGIEGIRKLTKVSRRPLLGTIIKPKIGLDEKSHARVAYESWAGGLDVVKDDENLSSMSFNSFKKRMKETFRLRDKAEKETGEKKIYMPNITAETFEMLNRAKIVDDFGGEYVMVDIITTGWAGLQTIRDRVKKVLHAHRAMHGALTRNPRHGMSMLAIAKCARLAGTDQLHIGTASIGKMNETGEECMDIEKEIESKRVFEHQNFLAQNWFDIKPVLAVASGGLHPGSIPKLLKKMGNDIVMQFGGGCHGHPDGTRAGASAIRQAADAAMQGVSLKEQAKKSQELASALKKFGIA